MTTAAPPPDASIDFVDHFDRSARAFADAVDGADPTAAVAACPGWTVLRLVEHLGQIHLWAEFCAANGRAPTQDETDAMERFDRTRPDLAADWYRSTAAVLAPTLRALDPDAPTWHPFPTEQVAAFWPRRQAHETAIHLWDLEHAAGREPSAIDAAFASDGIDEYFGVVLPRLRARGAKLPSGSFHVHCTDVDGEWLVWDDGEYHLVRAHRKGDAALRGPAQALLLSLWGRPHADTDALSPVGDEAVVDAWLHPG